MKTIYLLSILLLTNIMLCQNFNDEFKRNVDIVKIEEYTEFSYFKAIKKGAVVADEIDTRGQINIKTKRSIDTERIIESKSKHIAFPIYYSHDKSNDIFVINKYNFMDLLKYFDKAVSNGNDQFEDKKIASKKGYVIYQRTHRNCTVVHLKMTVGYYNKYTNCVKIPGNYDDTVEVIYLI